MWDWITGLLRDHWASVVFSLAGIGVGAWWGRHRARRQWERKEFLHRLNVSLTSIHRGTLRIRTVLEKNLQDVLLNRVATEKVLDAATRTTEADPVLPLAKDDAWFLLNGVLNEVSEHFATGLLREDLGAPTATGRYLICLTHEVAGAVRTRKIRAMMVQRELLENLPDACPALESPNHTTRWDTLQVMARLWQTEPWHFLQVEVSV